MKPRVMPLAAATMLSLMLTACGSPAGANNNALTSTDFPLTIMNCGTAVTLEKAPERVVLLESSPVSYLHSLGVMDKVVARAGSYPTTYFDAPTQQELDRIPLLTDKLDTSGHLQISQEVIMAQRPDMVLGTAQGLNRETLAASGIPLLEEPSFCPQPPDNPTFQDIGEQMKTYARAFGISDRGASAALALEERVKRISRPSAAAEKRTAAVLYPTLGGGATYAYGTKSMAHPQLEAAGFTNVFADVDQRVFEIGREELIGRNPDVLILLHTADNPDEISHAITSMKGAESITAIAKNDVMTQLFNFTEPGSPLAIDGLEHIIERFWQ
ncbi:iron complex transport system substrate-binding protein [Arthrobacter alpinus]|uniref:Iron complex transport system substrate-binding protein n=1 Tax=Arthrobacter alpinus TaxID=656366 RepID=A0A1H5GD17_9MICC|nr:ABC transporter substrate-binding protein [Arthrobacter alpinus]SEE13401.1 iron complex transport system substrate-binding protein [Arthrobacter alpinus]